MDRRTRIIVLSVGVLLALAVFLPRLAAARLPGNDHGYAPRQPIAFSHRLHAGEMKIDCLYCHSGAQESRTAGIPSPGLCMNCHKFVSAPIAQVRAEDKLAEAEGRKPQRVVSDEIAKIYAALGLDRELKPTAEKTPIEWVRIYRLPDFSIFDHRPHVAAGVSCQSCHGPVETMERVRQEQHLSMGWCVECHRVSTRDGIEGRPVAATLNCSACHY